MESKEEQMKKIAASLVRLRTGAGMTQAELAEKLNYTTKAVSKWECAESLPDIFVLRQITELFGVKLDSLFSPETVAQSAARQEEKKEGVRLFGLTVPMSGKRLCITVLSVIAVWFAAVAAFVLLRLFCGREVPAWLLFVAAVPASCVVWLVFNTLWGRKSFNQVIISLLLWSGLAFAYLLILSVWKINAWLIFLLGVPMEAALPLWHLMERGAEKKGKTAEAAGKGRK